MFTNEVNCNFLSKPRWFAGVLILCCSAVAEAQFGGMGGPPPAEQRPFPNGLPKMELMLKAALEHHPDVLAARSKLRTAEAELRQAEFKALKDILEVRDRWEKANRALNSGGDNADPTIVRERLAAIAAVEWELAFLLGTRGEAIGGQKPAGEKDANTGQSGAGTLPSSAVIEPAIPRGERAKSLKQQLGTQLDLVIERMPLSEFLKALSEKSGTRFLLNKQSLEDAGFPADSLISLDVHDLELGAALQVLVDLHNPISFVVRDYGILVTADSDESSKNVSVNDFWKLSEEELRDKLRYQRQEESNNAGGMMGGMGGSGIF